MSDTKRVPVYLSVDDIRTILKELQFKGIKEGLNPVESRLESLLNEELERNKEG